jgi:hypothetical protein
MHLSGIRMCEFAKLDEASEPSAKKQQIDPVPLVSDTSAVDILLAREHYADSIANARRR